MTIISILPWVFHSVAMMLTRDEQVKQGKHLGRTNKKKDRKKEIEKKTLTEAIMLIQCYYCFSICLVFLHMFSVSHMFSKHKENKFIILFFDDTILCNKSIDILTY